MKRNQKVGVLALAALLLLPACPKENTGRINAQQKAARERAAKSLADNSDGFYQYLQWEKFKNAAEFIPEGDARAQFISDMRKQPMKVTSFEILQVELDEDSNDGATVWVAMKVVRHSDLVEEERDEKHRWVRDKIGNWFVLYPFTE